MTPNDIPSCWCCILTAQKLIFLLFSSDRYFTYDRDFFGSVVDWKNVRESCVLIILSVFHNIGHIHNANFSETRFSRSYPPKNAFLKKRQVTFFWKYLVCGLKFEISEYPIKLPIITYSPYKYEVNRTKTHEIKAKKLCSFFFWAL